VYKLTKADEIELRIQQALRKESSLNNAVAFLLYHLSKDIKKLSFAELEKISIFLLNAGFYIELNKFLTDAVANNLEIPWGHFCESIFCASAVVSEGIKSALIEGAEHDKLFAHLAISKKLDFYDERLKVIREERIKKTEINREKKKKDLIQDYQTLHAQGLVDDANEIMGRLLQSYPDDTNILELANKNKIIAKIHKLDKYADHKKRETYIPLEAYQELDEESQKILENVERSMRSVLIADSSPELSHDFAIAQLMLENYSGALSFTPSLVEFETKIPENTLWLRFEILFQSRRFVELLEEIKISERMFVAKPDGTIALSYLKALCFWELDERPLAIQTMESILFVRPEYKSAEAFLHEWKSQ
jgi:hypothetical protein